MSFLSAKGQLSGYSLAVGVGGAGNGVEDVLITDLFPVGQYVCSIVSGVVGGSVTGGTLRAFTTAGTIASTPVGASGVKGTLTFIFTSDGITNLQIGLTGTGGTWTSVATSLQIIPVV